MSVSIETDIGTVEVDFDFEPAKIFLCGGGQVLDITPVISRQKYDELFNEAYEIFSQEGPEECEPGEAS